MPVLSIIACKMLEDELAHLLGADTEVRELFLIDRAESLGLSAKLRRLARPHLLCDLKSLIDRLNRRTGPSSCKSHSSGLFERLCQSLGIHSKAQGLVVVVSLLPVGLHSDLKQLQEAVYEQIRVLNSISDGILIFYGRCGNSLSDIKRDFPELSCDLGFLTDERGERVGDCISAALGGDGRYDRVISENRGLVMFMTPMWASNWSGMRSKGGPDGGRGSGLDPLFRGPDAKKVARIDTGLAFEPGFDEHVGLFAERYGLEVMDLPGCFSPAECSFRRAKDGLRNR